MSEHSHHHHHHHHRRSAVLSPATVLTAVLVLMLLGLTMVLVLSGQTGDVPLSADEHDYLLTLSTIPEFTQPDPMQEDRYYHKPVLITDDATVGVGMQLWSGLCAYMAEAGQLITPEDAIYLCEQKQDNIAAAIERAEHEVVPSVILLHGEEAAKAVETAMDTYAGTQFIVFDAVLSAPAANVCTMTVAKEDAGFLVGYSAAMEGLDEICVEEDVVKASDELLSGIVCGAEAGCGIRGKGLSVKTGSTSDSDTAMICSGDLSGEGMELRLGSGTPLTTVNIRCDNIARTALQQWANGGWNQFYGGKNLHYSLIWGTTVSMSETDWGFSRYNGDLYHQALQNLSKGSYQASATMPESPEWVTVSGR